MPLTAQVTVRSNFSPPLTLDSGGHKDTRPIIGTLLKLVRPSIDANIAGANFHYAPYGEPSGMGEIVLIGIFLLSLYGGYKLMRGKI